MSSQVEHRKRRYTPAVYIKSKISDKEPKIQSTWRFITDSASRALSLGTLVAVIGFLVLNSTLHSITGRDSFNIDLQQLVAWGFIFLLYFTMRVFVWLLLVALLTIFFLKVFFERKPSEPFNLEKTVVSTLQSLISLNSYSIVFLIVTTAFVCNYAISPEWVLHGSTSQQPVGQKIVSLVLKESATDWHLSPVSNQQSKLTKPLDIIMNYTDGLLVRDKDTGIVVLVKNEMIVGIIYQAATSTVVPTLGATNSSTP